MASPIRNFCIIAHIDHGKSTLADRFLELTGTVDKRNMKEQMLDTMELERERGITIKLQPVRMKYTLKEKIERLKDQKIKRSEDQLPFTNYQLPDEYTLNLIDTPGHVDFTYEVSRSLAAVEGAILLVDATQGVQAQTIANLYLAIEQGLTIIPVINKIDLPNANIEKTAEEIIHLLGCKREEILQCSGKTGEGVAALLLAVVEQVPPPPVHSETAGYLKALIFDSFYDDYQGVIAAVRVKDGGLKKGDKIQFMGTRAEADVLGVGHFSPSRVEDPTLDNGQIGFVVTGLKELGNVRVGDTITQKDNPAHESLPGYKEIKPMVYAGIFPKEGDDYQALRDAVDRLKLSDASLFYEPEHSNALGFGFRCGFLGMLHMEIFQERLRREFGLHIIATVPSVAYHVSTTKGEELVVKSPQDLPEVQRIDHIEEPWMTVDIITPEAYIGNVMSLIAERKGTYITTEYLSAGDDRRTILRYDMPLASLITDFYDKLKTVTSGYASLNYDFKEYRAADVVKLDILIAEEPVEALSTLVWQDEAFKVGKKIVESLKDTLPKHQFVLKIQAAIGGKIIAAERLAALRKDVTAKLYGGDVTRKMKLLQKQKKGKKKMMAMGKGKVEIPTEAYLAVLKR